MPGVPNEVAQWLAAQAKGDAPRQMPGMTIGPGDANPMPGDQGYVPPAGVIPSPMAGPHATGHDRMNYPPLRDYMDPSPQGEKGKVLGRRSQPIQRA